MTDIIPKATAGRYMGISNVATASAGPLGLAVAGVVLYVVTRAGVPTPDAGDLESVFLGARHARRDRFDVDLRGRRRVGAAQSERETPGGLRGSSSRRVYQRIRAIGGVFGRKLAPSARRAARGSRSGDGLEPLVLTNLAQVPGEAPGVRFR
jgi:hypothetical protein